MDLEDAKRHALALNRLPTVMALFGLTSLLIVGWLGSGGGSSWAIQPPYTHLADGASLSSWRRDGYSRLWEDKHRIADIVARWNGDIFWAPASMSSNVLTRFGDEARAVFGPIPEANCAEGVAIRTEVDGNVVELRPNENKVGRPLEFAHLNLNGRVEKWTKSILKCDKPSLAGGSVTFCGMNSRLNRVAQGSVEWLFLCRKSSNDREVWADPYWLKSNPKFRLFGTIGFNHKTGEIVFFDGRKDRTEFDWSKPLPPPGGHSYSDKRGRTAAEGLYDPTFKIQCFLCYDNKNPYIIDPHISQSRIGYFNGEDDGRAIAFSLGDYLPETPRLEGAPFRVIGSGYTRKYRADIMRATTVRDPAGNCTTCHTLTTQMTGQRFAADAVAREPWVSRPTGAQEYLLSGERVEYTRIAMHGTDWAMRSGEGKIHPWMLPEHGNELAELPAELSEEDWRELSDCLWGGGGRDCGYQPLYTPCLPPQAENGGDGSMPTGLTLSVVRPHTRIFDIDRAIEVRWFYLNSYGNVPARDDVRFDVAVREAEVVPHEMAPAPAEYPSISEITSESHFPTDDETSSSDLNTIIRDVSYVGHVKWTEPIGRSAPREYKISLPAACNQRYLVRILPKRYCFDQSHIVHGEEDHLAYVDVKC